MGDFKKWGDPSNGGGGGDLEIRGLIPLYEL